MNKDKKERRVRYSKGGVQKNREEHERVKRKCKNREINKNRKKQKHEERKVENKKDHTHIHN